MFNHLGPCTILLAATLISAAACAASPVSDGTEPARIGDWRELKFGLMLHWGLYSLPAGVWQGKNIEGYNEQIMHRAKISRADYAALANEFCAEKFDPDAIARMARSAGMRYVVITSKHHDGFSLWHTKFSRFNAVDATPFGKDAIKLLADACARQGLKFGVYYSLIDWNYPGAAPMSDTNSDPITPALEECTVGQLRELLTGYGPLCELWFDMSKPTPEQSRKIANLVRTLQPKCLVNGRIFNAAEDYLVCGDNQVPKQWLRGPWETPVSIYHDTWGYRSWQVRDDLPGKIREKVRELAMVTARGGNYLMNLGPKGDGSIVDFEAQVLEGIGRWLRGNGEAIFGARPEPHLALNFGYATSRPGRLYLFVREPPPDGVLRIPGWQAPTVKAHVLSGPAYNELASTREGDSLRISLPQEKVDPTLTVVAADFAGDRPFLPAGLVRLDDGMSAKLPLSAALPWYWAVGGDYYSQRNTVVARAWNIAAPRGGQFEVLISRQPSNVPAGCLVNAGASSFQCILPASDTPLREPCGRFTLPAGEPVSIILESATPGKELDSSIESIELVRCER